MIVRGCEVAALRAHNVRAARARVHAGARLRNGSDALVQVDYAIDRLVVGLPQVKDRSAFPARQRLVSYHEAGHAVMGLLTPDYDAVTKVTILPRSNGAGGFTLFTPSEERMESGMYTQRYLKAQLAVALGGRVAEEIVYGEDCLLYTSPSPRDTERSRMPSSA